MAKKLGILTSGGDCAGLNTVLRAVTLRAAHHGYEVVGLVDGTHGLLFDPPKVLHLRPDSLAPDLLRQGGTILGTTNKGDPFAFPMPDGSKKDRSQEMVDRFKALGCTGLIGIGGDGSLAILNRLATLGGFQLIGIPKTIDNDLGLTEVSVGYSTALDVATEALDRLQPTAASHDRIMILEVMGRDAGHIALAAGIAGGADVILLPEISWKMEVISSHLKKIMASKRNFALVVISEAARKPDGEVAMKDLGGGQRRYGGIGHYLAEKITETTGAETRVTVLGHIQRGGQPNAEDRIIASAFGVRAVDLLVSGANNRMVAWSNREVIDVPLLEAIKHYQTVPLEGTLVQTARGLGICLGDQ